jgi:hypothetical protein
LFIRQDSPVDAYWGIGADRTGENQLGIALMELRDRKLKENKSDLISFEESALKAEL